jgi:hypothetical protein
LWETSAYGLLWAATLPKSLNVAGAFPVKPWSRTRSLKEIRLNGSELPIAALGVFCLVAAAFVEAF